MPFWALVGLAVIGYFVWFGNIYSPDALQKRLKDCEYEATKVYGADIVKWREEHQTDVLNPYCRERDAMMQACIIQDGTCVSYLRLSTRLGLRCPLLTSHLRTSSQDGFTLGSTWKEMYPTVAEKKRR
jgi:hypothetical protein